MVPVDKLQNPAQGICFRTPNPKRSGSQAALRYDKYKVARTVGEALRAGAQKGDLKNDLERGFLTLLDRPHPPEPAPMAQPPPRLQLHLPSPRPTPPKRRREGPPSVRVPQAAPGQQARQEEELPIEPSLWGCAAPRQPAAGCGGGAPCERSEPMGEVQEQVGDATRSPGQGSGGGDARSDAEGGARLLSAIHGGGAESRLRVEGVAEPGFGTEGGAEPSSPRVDDSAGQCLSTAGPGAAVERSAEAEADAAGGNTEAATEIGLHRGAEPEPGSETELEDTSPGPLPLDELPVPADAPSQLVGGLLRPEPAVSPSLPDDLPAPLSAVLDGAPAVAWGLEPAAAVSGSACVAAGAGEPAEGGGSQERSAGQEDVAAPASSHPQPAGGSSPAEWECWEEGPDSIRLTCRYGLIKVKRELPEEDDGGADGAEGDALPEGADATEDPLLGLPGEEGAPSAAGTPGDLRQLFALQQRRRHTEGADQPGGEEEDSAGPQAEAEFEAAQLQSYESNEAERRKRAAEKREQVLQGDLAPCVELDQDLMDLLEGSMFEWLSEAENRSLLLHFLELRAKATQWYPQPAEAYFASQRAQLETLLPPEDCDDECVRVVAVQAVADFFREETARLEEELFAMPEPGRFVPRLFARFLEGAGDLGGSSQDAKRRCVAVD